MRLQQFNEFTRDRVADPFGVGVVVRAQLGEAQEKVGRVFRYVTLLDGGIGREQIGVEVGQFVVAGIGDGLAGPSGYADFRR